MTLRFGNAAIGLSCAALMLAFPVGLISVFAIAAVKLALGVS